MTRGGPATIPVGILAFDGVTMLDVSGPAEAFARANHADGPGYAVSYFSPRGGNVATSSGLTIADTLRPDELGALDTLVVPGSDDLAADAPDPHLLAALTATHPGARRVASVCTGAFALAHLGLLDGRRATTHWRHADRLGRRYPAVRVEPDTIHVRDGRYFTSAGITAGIDLALALIEDDAGAGAARATAYELVVFLQRPGDQSQFSAGGHGMATHHPLLATAIAAVVADPVADHTVATMAAHAAVSVRHLNRLFHDELGTTPARWIESVRLDRARHLILQGRSVATTARLAGFGSDESLRRAFARRMHTTPSEYRARFATSAYRDARSATR